MKRLLFILLSALLTLSPTFAKDKNKDKDAPQITLETREHDFGNISENGGAVSYEFQFTNTGTTPLIIISATAQCGCTRPSYPPEPIKPGHKAKIKVTYLPKGRPGEFNKTIRVRTNDPTAKRLNLKIRGVVIP